MVWAKGSIAWYYSANDKALIVPRQRNPLCSARENCPNAHQQPPQQSKPCQVPLDHSLLFCHVNQWQNPPAYQPSSFHILDGVQNLLFPPPRISLSVSNGLPLVKMLLMMDRHSQDFLGQDTSQPMYLESLYRPVYRYGRVLEPSLHVYNTRACGRHIKHSHVKPTKHTQICLLPGNQSTTVPSF